MRPELLIHVGYHKTATTWLQSSFFPRHPDLSVVGQYPDLAGQLIYPDGLTFHADDARRFFQPRIAAAVAASKIPVLTTERLSGNPHSGGYDSKTIADRLHDAFPQASILIVVRRQVDMAVSMYKQYVRVGGICTLREYLFPPLDGRIPLFRLEFLEYHRLAEYYASLFGPERVRVMVYEQFCDDPTSFIGDLCDFLDIRGGVSFPAHKRVNESLSDSATRLKRRVNRWHGGDSLFPVTPPVPRLTGGLFRAIQRFDRAILSRLPTTNLKDEAAGLIRDRFGASNRELARVFGLDLAQHGYDIC